MDMPCNAHVTTKTIVLRWFTELSGQRHILNKETHHTTKHILSSFLWPIYSNNTIYPPVLEVRCILND